MLEAILLTIITGRHPLVIAATGELVTERAGVSQSRCRSMMIMGAVCAFAGSYLTGYPLLGVLCGILAARFSPCFSAPHSDAGGKSGCDRSCAHHSRSRPFRADR